MPWHGLCSPVVMATGFVRGKWQFSTTAESTPFNHHQKICQKWLCWQTLQLCKIWCTSVHGGFWLNGWNITKFFLFIYTPLWELTYRSDASMDFRDCFFGCPFRGSNPSKTPILRTLIGVLSQTHEIEKHAYYQNYFIDSNQIFHSGQEHQMPLWVVQTQALQIQDDRRPPSCKNRHISATVWPSPQNMVRWCNFTVVHCDH